MLPARLLHIRAGSNSCDGKGGTNMRLVYLMVTILFVCIFIISGCAQERDSDYINMPLPAIESSVFESSSGQDISSSSSEATQSKLEEINEVDALPPALAPDIYTRLAEQSKYYPPTAIIAVTNEYAQIVDLLGFWPLAAWEDYLIGIGDDRFTQIYHISTGEIYDSLCWSFENTRFFSNGVAAIFNYQDSQIDGNSNISQVLLMDQYCVPLEHQLHFDYGTENEYGLGKEYLILDVAYRSEEDKYVTVFSRNPYFTSSSDEMYDNTVCQLGIAVFASDGKQLLRYELDGVLYPLNTKQGKNAAQVPLLYLLDEDTALIIPQMPGGNAKPPDDSGLNPLEGYSSSPLLINLNSHAFRRLSTQEMQSLLDENGDLSGKFVAYGDSGYWEIEKTMQRPFIIREQDNNLLVFGEGKELPYFALPSNYNRLVFCHEYRGIYYLLFC